MNRGYNNIPTSITDGFFSKNKSLLIISTIATTITFFVYSFFFKPSDKSKRIKPSGEEEESNKNNNNIETVNENLKEQQAQPQQQQQSINTQINEQHKQDIISKPKPSPRPIKSLSQSQTQIQLIKVTDPIQLPHSLIISIFESLTFRDLQRCKRVNSNWNKILCKLDRIWQKFIIDKWGFNSLPESNSLNETIEYGNYFKVKYTEEMKRLGFKAEQFIISVHEQCSDFTDPNKWKLERVFGPQVWWRKRMLEELTCLTMTRLEWTEKGQYDTGRIVDVSNNRIIGQFRFINVYDARAKFEQQKFLDMSNESPFTGDLLGYFNFSLDTLQLEECRSMNAEFLKTLTFQTRGIISNLHNQITVKSVILESCKLKHVFGKGGMNDGDCLLDTDLQSTYIVSLIESIQKFLDSKGVGYNAVEGGCKVNFIDQTSHNPIRFTGHLPQEALSLELPLWIYNSVILQNKRLWGRRLE